MHLNFILECPSDNKGNHGQACAVDLSQTARTLFLGPWLSLDWARGAGAPRIHAGRTRIARPVLHSQP